MSRTPSRPTGPTAQELGTLNDAGSPYPSAAQDPADLATFALAVPELGGSGTPALPHRIGDYAILRVLGEGGMGTVYLAEDARLGRKAAVKTMKPALAADPANRERFLREARAAAAVEHDNIVPIWQVGEASDGSPFIAMPFLQGQTLADRLAREPVPNLGLVLKVAREVADGLAAAHARGLVHRDIKPANIWVEGDPDAKDIAQQVRRCKILDFGLARSAEKEESHLTANGAILGTPAFMAPEQAYGEKVDARADLFSLGVMLYRMATGKLPFEGNCVIATLASLATHDPPPARAVNRAVPQPVSDLIERLMSKDPAGRPESAAEAAAAVRQIAKDLQAKKGNTETGLIPPRSPRKAAEAAPAPKPAKRPKLVPKADPSRVPLIAIAAALLVVLPLGAWLAVAAFRDKGPVAAPAEGDGKPGPVKPGDPPKAVPPVALDPDRKAAEWVLSIGGTVKVDGDREVKAAADLGPGNFRVTSVDLKDNQKADDAGMAAFQGCKNLTTLNLKGTQVGDAGLAHVAGCTVLAVLDVNGTQVGDAGLASLKGCNSLWIVGLAGTRVTDAGLARLAECKGLMHLNLSGTQVDGSGLARLAECRKLAELLLERAPATDAGLSSVVGMTGLTRLVLKGTKATAAKVEELRKALPECRIEWDGIAGPAAAGDDRKVAEVLLSRPGAVCVNDGPQYVWDAANLPVGPIRLTKARIDYGAHADDAALAPLKDCKELASLDVTSPKVTDAGLAHLKDFTTLKTVKLFCQKVTAAGLAHFRNCKGMQHFHLHATKVDDAGLAFVKDYKNLLSVHLKEMPVGDAGIAHLKDCKKLLLIRLEKTKVTAAGIDDLKKALPMCKFNWDGK